MSEYEEAAGPAKNTNFWIALVCVIAVGGCILMCVGIVSFGLVVPVVVRQQEQQRQAERNAVERQAAAANAAAQQAAEQAAAKARSAESNAAATDERPDPEKNALPAAEETPANETPQPE